MLSEDELRDFEAQVLEWKVFSHRDAEKLIDHIRAKESPLKAQIAGLKARNKELKRELAQAYEATLNAEKEASQWRTEAQMRE